MVRDRRPGRCGAEPAWRVGLIQTRHSLKRNYPILANIRFLLEGIRPEIRQYFLESDVDGVPFNRSKRAIVYQRAKGDLDKRPFGTMQDIYAGNFEWINHSIHRGKFTATISASRSAVPIAASPMRIRFSTFPR